MIYIQLFLSFLQIGAFSFGGGYAAMPLIQSQIVDLHHWLDFKEFTERLTNTYGSLLRIYRSNHYITNDTWSYRN